MKSKFIALSLIMGLLSFNSIAAPITPDEALSSVLQKMSTSRMKAPAKAMRLAYQLADEQTENPTLYVFAPAEGSGFIVTAADNATELLLGYSDSAFDPANIPPALNYWLEVLSGEVAYSASHPLLAVNVARGLAFTMPQGDVKASAPSTTPRQRAARAAIAPLVDTRWNQSAPYNDLCPTYSGERCVTGCVATAMAQVMKYYEWPTTGIGGTFSYTWDTGGTTLSLNFSSQTFDWANMTNTYSTSSTTAQNAAVAQLMYSCGIAASMNYNISSNGGSGASYIYAGAGMIDYLNYDKSMRFLDREWFSLDDWKDLVYSELAAGRPVLYSGQSAHGGHAFVCDGYDTDDFFHINWGWGGMSDGYFKISILDPDSHGIGGGSGAYSSGQNILINIQPQNGTSSIAPAMAYGTGLVVSEGTFTRSSSVRIPLSGGFYNFALGKASYDIAVKLTKSDNTESYVQLISNTEFESLSGYGGLNVPSTYFPVGEYDVSLVFKTAGADASQWTDLYYNRYEGVDHAHMVVTTDRIVITNPSVSAPEDEYEGEEEEEPEFSSTAKYYSTYNSSDTGFHPGHVYKFTMDCTLAGLASGDTWSKDVVMLVLADDRNTIIGSSSTQKLTYTSNTTKTAEFDITVPYHVGAATCYVVLCTVDGSRVFTASPFYTVRSNYHPTEGYCQVAAVDYTGWGLPPAEGAGLRASNPVVIDDEYGGFVISFSCPAGPWSDTNLCGAVADASGNIVGYTTTKSLSMELNATAVLAFYVGSRADWCDERDATYGGNARAAAPKKAPLASNTTYQFFPWSQTYGQMSSSPVYFQLQDVVATGVESSLIDASPSTPAHYYNLLGSPVDNPTTGLYIRVQGGTATKVMIK